MIKIRLIKYQERENVYTILNIDGAHLLNDNEYILDIITLEGQFNFCPGLKAKLIEINSNILANPSLIKTSVIIYNISLKSMVISVSFKLSYHSYLNWKKNWIIEIVEIFKFYKEFLNKTEK